MVDEQIGQNAAKEVEPVPKHDNTALYVIVALIVVVILSALLFYYLTKPEPQKGTLTYNKFDFIYREDSDIWTTQWQNNGKLYNIYFHFNPLEAEKVPIYEKKPLSPSFNSSYFLVTFDPLANNTDYFKIAVAELDLSLVRVFGRVPIAACSENSTLACHSRPIKNCDNTDEPVFYLKQEGQPSIVLDDNCIIITGSNKDLIRAVDRLLYHWYRIIAPTEPIKIIEN